jgi:hypothetical protein
MMLKNKILIFFVSYFILQLLITNNYISTSDEGTHAIIGLFYKDLIYNLKNFHSLNDMIKFGINYLVKYPKISLYYPPIYYVFLAVAFMIQESVIVVRILNILLTLLTAYTIYKLSHEFFEKEWPSVLSSIFFLSFSLIFFYADKIMIDTTQILLFSVALLYYVKVKKMKVKDVHVKNIILLSILISLSFLVKFYSIFLPIIILIDSFLKDKKFFKKIVISLILSGLIVSPYVFLYYKTNLYKMTFGKSLYEYSSNLVYFDVFLNFGIFLGIFVGISIIYFFYKNRKNYLFFIWLFIPLIFLLFLGNKSPRYAFILMPIYAMACGFTLSKIKEWSASQKRNILIILVIVLLVLQMFYNVYTNSKNVTYPVDEMMKTIKKDDNILILSEEPVYSSIFTFYGRTNQVPGNIIRPCFFWKNKLTEESLNNWGIKYIIDQENNVSDELIDSLNLQKVWEKTTENQTFRLFEKMGNISKVDCNFVCAFNDKVCKNQSISDVIKLINKNIYLKSD